MIETGMMTNAGGVGRVFSETIIVWRDDVNLGPRPRD